MKQEQQAVGKANEAKKLLTYTAFPMPKASALLCTAFLLTSCGSNVLPPIPTGEQTVAGTLRAAPLSAVRRGSHYIEQNGVNVYYAESSLVNLRKYQNKRVTLRGTFEHNTDPEDLPVLVVESVVDAEDSVKEHTLGGIHVRLRAPVEWKLIEREGKYQFRLTEDEEDPLLVLWQEEGEELPEGGVPVVVDATRATKLIDDLSNTQIIVVKRDGVLLHMRFSPGERLTADRLSQDFLVLLKSVNLLENVSESSSSATGTGGVLGTPCGGTAGILCPEGEFCDIQNFEENIGRCRRL